MKYSPLLVILALALVSCTANKEPSQQNTKLNVVATFYPLYDLTRSILGDKGMVYTLVPANTEPHDYEPKPSDIQKLNSANAFVTMGIEFAAFEDTLIESINPDVAVIPAGRDITLLKASDEQGANDPHIWLSPKNAQEMAAHIVFGLRAIDPKNQEYYAANGNLLIAELGALDQEFKEGLTSCKKDAILVNHNAFSYLGKDYEFRTITISGLEPEVEPTPLQIKKIIDEAWKNDIKYVLYENLIDPRVATTIAQEVGAQALELNPLEGSSNLSETYFTLMRKNLDTLRIALECP